MSIPQQTAVLVIGGGPGGAYAASILAREGINVVVLEAEVFPRYHIGESLLPSMREFLKLVDADELFDNHGFRKKKGASFKFDVNKEAGFADFLKIRGEGNYSWNVIRSEADEILLRHAQRSGAKVFEGVKVTAIKFKPLENAKEGDLGQPISASYVRKEDGAQGEIAFDYLIDASGRAGILSTKYMKNRHFNTHLKNVALWGYYTGAKDYGEGMKGATSPFFEALSDESGWAWFIPLHDGTTSVGVVVDQKHSIQRKKELGGPSTREFFSASTDLAPTISNFLSGADLVSDIKSASDYSYTAASYVLPHARLVGDAAAFIDPCFSSGVHLAMTGGLSAAVTILASMKGDCDESSAMSWHSTKIENSYVRFLIIVLASYRQIRHQKESILSNMEEKDLDRTFEFFRPIIQGNSDVRPDVSRGDMEGIIDFCTSYLKLSDPTIRPETFKKIGGINGELVKASNGIEKKAEEPLVQLSEEETKVLRGLRSFRFMGVDGKSENFGTDVIDGYIPRLSRGNMGLTNCAA